MRVLTAKKSTSRTRLIRKNMTPRKKTIPTAAKAKALALPKVDRPKSPTLREAAQVESLKAHRRIDFTLTLRFTLTPNLTMMKTYLRTKDAKLRLLRSHTYCKLKVHFKEPRRITPVSIFLKESRSSFRSASSK